jgi:anti-anti-sigma regulatory factor
MVMADAVLVSQYGARLELQVQGRGSMQQCPAMRMWVEERIGGGCTRVWIDLSRATHLDSTFIGTLLILNRRLLAGGGERIILAAPSAACAPLLSQMHVQNQFVVSYDPPELRQWQDELRVDANTLSSCGFKQNVVDAHQELANLGGPASEQFQELAAQMAEELKPLPKRPGSLDDTIRFE